MAALSYCHSALCGDVVKLIEAPRSSLYEQTAPAALVITCIYSTQHLYGEYINWRYALWRAATDVVVFSSSKTTSSNYCDGAAGLHRWPRMARIVRLTWVTTARTQRFQTWRSPEGRGGSSELTDTASLPVCWHVFDVRRRWWLTFPQANYTAHGRRVP